MGDWNPNNPGLVGDEVRFTSSRSSQIGGATSGWAFRFRGPGGGNITGLAAYLASVGNGGSGFGGEIVNTLTVTTSTTTVFPGTDTGKNVVNQASQTAWGNADGSTPVLYTSVAQNNNDSLFAKNVFGVDTTSNLAFRGNIAALTGVRILNVQVWARAKVVPGNGSAWLVPMLSNNTVGTTTQIAQGGFQNYLLGSFTLNPATAVAWTLSDVNAMISTTATTTFGCQGSFNSTPGNVGVAGIWLVITTCPENRIGNFYISNPAVGWNHVSLSNVAAQLANTWYWAVLWADKADSSNSLVTNVLSAPTIVVPSSASGTGEHRQFYEVAISGAGGVTAINRQTTGEIGALLLDQSGTYITQGDPYAAYSTVAPASSNPPAQTITMPAQSYTGIKVAVGWATQNVLPDQPLTVEIRSTSYGGTLIATATINPTTIPAPGAVQDVYVSFPSTFAASAAQYWVRFVSSAVNNWAIPLLDTASNSIVSGITAANIEGQSVGGTTDTYVQPGGSAASRYDIPVTVASAPQAPGSITVTAKLAGVVE